MINWVPHALVRQAGNPPKRMEWIIFVVHKSGTHLDNVQNICPSTIRLSFIRNSGSDGVSDHPEHVENRGVRSSQFAVPIEKDSGARSTWSLISPSSLLQSVKTVVPENLLDLKSVWNLYPVYHWHGLMDERLWDDFSCCRRWMNILRIWSCFWCTVHTTTSSETRPNSCFCHNMQSILKWQSSNSYWNMVLKKRKKGNK